MQKGCSNKILPEVFEKLKNWENQNSVSIQAQKVNQNELLTQSFDVEPVLEQLKDAESEGEFESNMDKWFVGTISRNQAEKLLEGREEGTFLVRLGESTGEKEKKQ